MKSKKSLLVVTASLLLGLTITGCGGNKEDSPTTSTNPTTVTPTTPEPSSNVTPEPSSTVTPGSSSSISTIPDGSVTIDFGEKGNSGLPNDKFVYWNDQWWCGSSVTIHSAYIHEDKATFDYEYDSNSTTNWGFQVFYKNTSLTAGKTYKLTMNINSEDSIKVVVNGTAFNLVSGDNSIEVTYVEGAQVNDAALASIDMQIDKSTDLRNTIVISNYSWEETAGQLSAPEGIVIATESSDNSKVIQFAKVEGATGYTVIYYNADTNEEVAREEITAAGAKLTKELEDGIYIIKLIAKGDGENVLDSLVSTSFGYLMIGNPTEVDPNEKVEIKYGEETAMPLNKYIYWNDQWWCGSSVTVHDAYMYNHEIVFDYEYDGNSATDWGFQVFYKNIALTIGKEYKLTMNINTEDDVKVKINGTTFNLKSGDNDVEVTYNEGGVQSGSLSMQVDKSTDLRNTIKLTNVIWTATDGSSSGNTSGSTSGDTGDTGNKLSNIVGGVVNEIPNGYIFACAAVTNATGYHLQILDSTNSVVAEQDITNGGTITCHKDLPAGTYSIQVKAIGDETYEDSDYVVIKTDFVISSSEGSEGGETSGSGEITTENECYAVTANTTAGAANNFTFTWKDLAYKVTKAPTQEDCSVSVGIVTNLEFANLSDNNLQVNIITGAESERDVSIILHTDNGDYKLTMSIVGGSYSGDCTIESVTCNHESEGSSSGEAGGETSGSGEVTTDTSSMPEGAITINFGEEKTMGYDEFVYWNDQEWCGSNVVVHTSYMLNDELVFDYEFVAGNCDYGFQIFYKNSNLTSGKEYKLTLTINSKDAISIDVNGKTFELVSGDNSIEVIYTEGSDISSIDMQFGKPLDSRNTIKLSNISWTEVA